MRPTDHLTLVERNEQFVEHLREQVATSPTYAAVRDRVHLVHASLEDLPENEPFDVIVSGLPLNNFSVELVDSLLAKMQKLLAPGGTISFFEYVAIRRAKAIVSSRADRERLRGIAAVLHRILHHHELRRDLVLANVPPAWVHHVSFAAGGMERGAGSKSAAANNSDFPLPAPRSSL